MSDYIRGLLEQIRELEEELMDALEEQEVRFSYRINGARVEFEQSVKEAHRQIKVGLLRWFRQSRPQNILSVPFIYSMIVPFLILDAFLTVYQAVCFRLYNIAPVRRSDYIVIDRHHLGYLNAIEKLNCVYCGYANGLIGYAREIAARTEQYWCPIKHARKVRGTHDRLNHFLEYGQANQYHEKLKDYRNALADKDKN